jgi:Type I phosphodiesterase / nucleotide pyrophosphatase
MLCRKSVPTFRNLYQRLRSMFSRVVLALAIVAAATPAASQTISQSAPHSVVIFVADGLRSRVVNELTAPNLSALARQGVSLINSHSLFPTFTMANASAIATGHYFGDTGVFSNTLYIAHPVPNAAGSPTPFIENDAVLGDLDAQFAGNFLNEDTIVKLAREKGYSTAAIGKHGPTLLFDHTERSGVQTIIFDDITGTPQGIPLSPEITERLKAAGLPMATPPRGANGVAGNATTPGTKSANVVQQDYFAAVATRAVLPLFAARGKPFLLVFWSRDPDGTQHNQGDSFLTLKPGINGPAALAAIRNADDDLGRLRAALAELGLAETTDIIVTADHGFATISKESATSPAAHARHADAPASHLPRGFLAFDLAKLLEMPIIDPDNNFASVPDGAHSRNGNGLIGGDKDHPKLVVAANSGSDLIYIPDGDKALASRVVGALLTQDYVSGIFVDERIGRFPGTLSLADINLDGTARTPRPAIVVNFLSFDTVCGEPVRCPVVVADATLQQGQGSHGSFSRAETWNFMALAGPDFKAGFIDMAPVSNADVGRTVAAIIGLEFNDKGLLVGRVLREAMPGGVMPEVKSTTIVSEPADNGLRTVLDVQSVGNTRYFDAGGFFGRTLGLSQPSLAGARQPNLPN